MSPTSGELGTQVITLEQQDFCAGRRVGGHRSGRSGPSLHKLANNEPPLGEDLAIPRPLGDRCGGTTSTPAILDVPAWGATPRGSFSPYTKEEKPHGFGYFFT